MLRILDRYVARTYLTTFVVVLFFVLGIFVVLGVFGVIDDLLDAREVIKGQGRTVHGVLLEYYLVSTPFNLRMLLPFVTLIAATICLVRLMRGNEITPMIAAGWSPARISRPIFVIAALVTLLMLGMQEWVVPRLADARIRLGWLINGNVEGEIDDVPPLVDGNGNTWSMDLYYPLDRSFTKGVVMRYSDPASGRLMGTVTVARAVWREGGPGGPGFYPEGGVRYPPEGTEEHGHILALSPDEPLPTDLTPVAIELELARESREAGKMLSISEAARMVALYPDLPRQRVSFHTLMTWPIANLLLLLLGLPLIFKLGESSLFAGVGIAAVVCAGFFVVDTVFQDLGGRGSFPPTLAAWLPIILGSGAVLAMKDALRF